MVSSNFMVMNVDLMVINFDSWWFTGDECESNDDESWFSGYSWWFNGGLMVI